MNLHIREDRLKEIFTESITEALQPINKRLDNLEKRLDNLESRVDRYSQLLMILVSDTVRDQIKKDDLYPFVTDQEKVQTAVSRVLDRQNGLSQMILNCLENQD